LLHHVADGCEIGENDIAVRMAEPFRLHHQQRRVQPRFHFGQQLRLEVEMAFEAELHHQANHRGVADAGAPGKAGGRAKAGSRVFGQQQTNDLFP
jgi:hypothetical protein